MSETIAAVLPGLAQDVEAKPYTLTLLERSLAEQGDLSAVERFSARHDADTPDLKTGIYRALLPARAPAPGEQFAFEVDLDACSGCKACVTACHSLNGLDEAETWRSVGFLHGGSAGTFAAGLLASRSSSDLPASFSVIAVSAAGPTRGLSGVAAVFIVVNSLAGLAGALQSGGKLHAALPLWPASVVIGGWFGAAHGSRHLDRRRLRQVLAVILVLAAAKMFLT